MPYKRVFCAQTASLHACRPFTSSQVAASTPKTFSFRFSTAKLGRNNTVSGGERSAARMKLFTALGERIKEADEAVTSGGEERPVVSTPSKRRRRRSARNSNKGQTTATDESEVLSTTPTHTSTSLPYTQPPFAEAVRTASTTPIPIQPISTPNIDLYVSIAENRQTTPVRAVHNHFKRRSIVVEQDDDATVPPQSTYRTITSRVRYPFC
jgi:hypothetical protein